MDLGTVKKKMDNAVYRDVEEFIGDARLVFDNAILYNGKRFPSRGLALAPLIHTRLLFARLAVLILSCGHPLFVLNPLLSYILH
jgi:hypothetical protein